MSVHAAGLQEGSAAYVTVDLSASSLQAGVDRDFRRLNKSFEAYGIAGALSLQNFADMGRDSHRQEVTQHAALLAYSIGESATDIEPSLRSLISRHAAEWKSFTDALGDDSFVNHWAKDTA